MSDSLDIRPTLLLVDDQSINNTILGESLRDSYVLKFATSGEEALRIAAETPRPDMVLLDVLMPEMDGFEVCRQLKENAETAAIPVIFVTAMDDQINEEHGLEIGAVDYISKPASPAVVRARVKLHLHLQQYREFLEGLLERRTGELESAQDEAKMLLAFIDATT